MRFRSRTTKLALGFIATLAIAGVATFTLVRDPKHHGGNVVATGIPSSSTSASAPGRPPAPHLTERAANRLGQELRSHNAKRVAAAIQSPKGWKAPPATVDAFARYRSMTVEPGSVRITGNGMATAIYQTVSSSGTNRWMVSLVYIDGQWKLVTSPEED
ncbi:hypothetical protein [Kribbella ginsengisoli]|uniref:DUF4878 domain-containing protein n=1 Tax=Kribbella ginsengisoli TaxID=363865 RepID=A0ABP6VKS8_9ACTN